MGRLCSVHAVLAHTSKCCKSSSSSLFAYSSKCLQMAAMQRSWPSVIFGAGMSKSLEDLWCQAACTLQPRSFFDHLACSLEDRIGVISRLALLNGLFPSTPSPLYGASWYATVWPSVLRFLLAMTPALTVMSAVI